jgi:hypothetical protein
MRLMRIVQHIPQGPLLRAMLNVLQPPRSVHIHRCARETQRDYSSNATKLCHKLGLFGLGLSLVRHRACCSSHLCPPCTIWGCISSRHAVTISRPPLAAVYVRPDAPRARAWPHQSWVESGHHCLRTHGRSHSVSQVLQSWYHVSLQCAG